MSAAVRFKHRGIAAAVQRAKAEAPQSCACGCDAQAWRLMQAAGAAADHAELGVDTPHPRMGQLKPWERFHITYAREIAIACWAVFALVVWALKP